MFHCFHTGVDVPPPLPRTSSIPTAPARTPETADLEIVDPGFPGGLPPVGEPAPPEPALRVFH